MNEKRFFFITGLPRSRTAWLANFFSDGTAFCYHEAVLLTGMKAETLPDLFNRRREGIVGNSDSAIPFYAAALRKMFPDAPFILIEGNFEKSLRECNEIFGEDSRENLLICQRAIEKFEAEYRPWKLRMESLDDESIMSDVWEAIIGTPFDAERFRQLRDFNIMLTESGLEKRRKLKEALTCR